MLSFAKKLQEGLSKTKTGMVEGITRIINKAQGIDEDVLEELEEHLLLGDVGVDCTDILINRLRELRGELSSLQPEGIKVLLKDEMQRLLSGAPTSNLEFNGNIPHVISIVGVNGTGKTTTIGKLAHRYNLKGKKVLLAAADTFRAAAIEQLEIWRSRANVDIVPTQPGADPASVAFDALKAAMARGVDVLLIDTAGRLHTKSNLMAELTKIHRVLSRQCPGAPHEVLLVIDATTGQNGLSQAKKFAEAVDVTGIALTKLDGTAKGGIIFSIVKELNIPVQYIGIGEKIEDLEEFEPQSFIEALFA